MNPTIFSEPVRYVDAHCHVDLFPDPIAVMHEARCEGVGIVAVTNTPSVFDPMVRLAVGFPNVTVALGLHPELAVEREAEIGLIPELIRKTRVLGEIGLDGRSRDPRAAASQLRVLRAFIESASAVEPMVMTVHTRQAAGLALDCLAEIRGVVILHWFSGTIAQLKSAVARGWRFSVNLAMFGSSKGRSIVAAVPPALVLTETDGPFARAAGKPARPVDVRRVVDELGSIWNVGHEEARARTVENFWQCFSIDGPEQ